MIRSTILGMLVILVAAVPAWSDDAGTAGMAFLKIPPGGRPAAMGGAYSALATDVHALAYNPGGLGLVRQSELTLMHTEYFTDINYEYAGFVGPRVAGGTMGASVTYLDLGSFQRTTIGAGGAPVLGGDFDAGDLAFSVGYGRQATPELAWGVAGKYLREKLDDVTGQGWAVDLGVIGRIPSVPGLTLAAGVANLGPGIRYQNERAKLPILWRGGAGYTFGAIPLTLALDLKRATDSNWGVAVGGEYLFQKTLALRAGYDPWQDAGSGFTCGLGVALDNFQVDYAFEPGAELGDIHRISLSVKLGEPALPATPAAAIPAPAPAWTTSRAPAPAAIYAPAYAQSYSSAAITVPPPPIYYPR